MAGYPTEGSDSDSVPDGFLQVYLTNCLGEADGGLVSSTADGSHAEATVQPGSCRSSNADAAWSRVSATEQSASCPGSAAAAASSSEAAERQELGTTETPAAFLERHLPVLQNLLLDRLLHGEIQRQEEETRNLAWFFCFSHVHTG